MTTKNKSIIGIVLLIIITVLGYMLFINNNDNTAVNQSVFTDQDSVNRDFFIYKDNDLTEERLVEQMHEGQLDAEFGAKSDTDDSNSEVVNYFRDQLMQDGWSIEKNVTAGPDSRIDASKVNKDYEYKISVLANEQDNGRTVITYSLRTVEVTPEE